MRLLILRRKSLYLTERSICLLPLSRVFRDLGIQVHYGVWQSEVLNLSQGVMLTAEPLNEEILTPLLFFFV